MSSLFKKVAPIAVSFIPGVGPLAGAALGAGLGAVSGGGLKGALAGGLSGYAGAGGSSILGKALGATGATATGLGSGLLGAASGGVSGGVKGALTGGALGGLGGYANAGGFDDLYKGSALQDLYTGASGALDRVSGGISDLYNGSDLQSAFKSGSDALQSIGITGGSENIATAPIAGGGGASSYSSNSDLPYNTPVEGLASTIGNESRNLLNSAGTGAVDTGINGFNTGNAFDNATNIGADVAQSSNSYFSPIASAALGTYSNDKAEKALLEQQRNNQALLAPYQNFSFNPQDLQNDPGYQFNLAQGNQAQDRAQLARGGYFSGNALKEAQTFGQGLADNTYNSAFNRALQTNSAGLQGALAGAGINDNIGNIKANSATNTGNLYSGALGSVLGGNSFNNTGALQGGFDMQELLRQLQGSQGRSSYYGS